MKKEQDESKGWIWVIKGISCKSQCSPRISVVVVDDITEDAREGLLTMKSIKTKDISTKYLS